MFHILSRTQILPLCLTQNTDFGCQASKNFRVQLQLTYCQFQMIVYSACTEFRKVIYLSEISKLSYQQHFHLIYECISWFCKSLNTKLIYPMRFSLQIVHFPKSGCALELGKCRISCFVVAKNTAIASFCGQHQKIFTRRKHRIRKNCIWLLTSGMEIQF